MAQAANSDSVRPVDPGERVKRKRRRAGPARTRRLRLALLAIVALGATGLAIVAYETDLLRSLELSTVNTRFSIRGRQRPPANIVLVEIDATTFDELGLQWPFPRRVHARVIENIARDHPKAIAYDVQFTEASACPLSANGSQPPPGQCPQARSDETALLAALENAGGRTVMATTETEAHGNTRFLGSSEGNALLSEVGSRPANALLPNDPGGVLRRVGFSVGGLKTLAVASAEVAEGHRVDAARVRRRPRLDRLLRAERDLPQRVVLDGLPRPAAARLLPRQDRGRRSLGAVAAGHPPDLHRQRNAGSRSPGQRDRDGTARPAAALGRGVAGPGADRADGLRRPAGQPAVRPDRHDRAGRGARGGVHGGACRSPSTTGASCRSSTRSGR